MGSYSARCPRCLKRRKRTGSAKWRPIEGFSKYVCHFCADHVDRVIAEAGRASLAMLFRDTELGVAIEVIIQQLCALLACLLERVRRGEVRRRGTSVVFSGSENVTFGMTTMTVSILGQHNAAMLPEPPMPMNRQQLRRAAREARKARR